MNIAVTQCCVHLPERDEYRDCLDRGMTRFLEACGFACLPMPTLVSDPAQWLRAAGIRGVLISGGNDLAALADGDISPERDVLEHALLEIAEKQALPVFGICRGLQIMAHHYGAHVVPVNGHAGRPHLVRGSLFEATVVNSYHNYGVFSHDMPARLRVLARSEDGFVEAFCVSGLAQMAVMWHPEREKNFTDSDVALVGNFFRTGGSIPD